MREIQLTRGQVALVDDADYEALSQHKWHAWWSPDSNCFYAMRRIYVSGGKDVTVAMHRQILGLEQGDKRQGDHKNLNSLGNQRENLRIATAGQNRANIRKRCTNASGYKGVHWRADAKKWRAEITVNYKNIHLGYHPTAESAHAAYRQAAEHHFGEFARSA